MYVNQGGGYVPGVPARDLTNQEAKDYGVEDSPLYVKDGAPEVSHDHNEDDIDEGVDYGDGS